MKVVCAGTPEPAVVALERLIRSEHEVVGVITRQDARHGRGRTLHPSPVKACALEHDIEVRTPATLKAGTEDGEELRHWLREVGCECVPIVAYGNLVPDDLLGLPRHGWVNVHFSLLPLWRGAAPVQAALAAGDDVTGVSTFRLEKGLDTGPVYGTVTEQIGPRDTADDLLERLAYSGAELLVSTLDGIAAGALEPREQVGEASYAPKITTDAARIRWADPAFVVDRTIRAHTPGPGAWTMLGKNRLKVGPVTVTEVAGLAPGEVRASGAGVVVGTGSTAVELGLVQPSGKKMMAAADWARGRNVEGEQLQ